MSRLRRLTSLRSPIDVQPRSSEHRADPAGRTWGIANRLIRGRLSSAAAIDGAIATLAVVLVASPLLFTDNGFAPDFTSDLWMASVQQHMIAAHLHPTLFLNTVQQGIFQPQFAFYGGTLFAITGALAVVLGGSTILAFELITLAAIAAAYGGLFWIARQLGVRGRLAHAPALVFVTSAYYVTDLYGRGAWAEFTAVSVLMLVMAAALRLARGPWRTAPAVCLVVASFVVSGSHNITLLLSSTLIVLALAGYWLLSGLPRRLPWRRMMGVLGLVVLGVGLNGWFLLPDVSYAHNTLISIEEVTWAATGFFNSFGVVFDPLRTVPSQTETPGLYVQVPDLALIWGLLMLPLVWRERRLRAAVATALVALVTLLTVIMSQTVYSHLPNLFQKIQFPYRFQTYVTLSCAALVLLGTLTLTRRAARRQHAVGSHGARGSRGAGGRSGRGSRGTGGRLAARGSQGGRGSQGAGGSLGAGSFDRLLAAGLMLAVVYGIALCVWQLWVPNTRINGGYYVSYANRAETLRSPPTVLPKSWYAPNNFGDHSLPLVSTPSSGSFPAASVDDERLAGTATVPPGPFATNIAGGPYLVHVGGDLRVVGRTSTGYLVLERTKGGSRRIPFEVSTQMSAGVVLGRLATALAALVLLALALIAGVRSWRRRAAARPAT